MSVLGGTTGSGRGKLPELSPEQIQGHKMYSARAHLENPFAQEDKKLAHIVGLPRAERTAHENAFAAMVRRMRLESHAETLWSAAVNARVAAHRRQAAGEEIDGAAAERKSAEARRLVSEQFAGEDAEQLIARARAFAQSDDELRALVATEDLGSEPAVVLALVSATRLNGFKE